MKTLLAFVALLLAACASTNKTYSLTDLPERQLTFSYGGGFTGEYNEYLLFPNGQLYHRRKVINEVPFRPLEPLDPEFAREMFSTYDNQKFGGLGYDDPGNMTYTITSIQASDTTRVTWGGTEVKPREELRSYWRRMMQAVDSKKPLGAEAKK